MIILRKDATQAQINAIIGAVGHYGLSTLLVVGATATTLQLIGEEPTDLETFLGGMPGVEEYRPVNLPYKLISRKHHPEYGMNGASKIISVGGVDFGGEKPVIIAGPCTVYNEKQVMETARIAKECGADMLRGGAFKPRTNPHTFRGIGEDGLKMLAEARAETGLPFVTEALSVRDVALVAGYADMIQLGTRNSQNQDLLLEAGRSGKPILLKRGYWQTIEEWLQSAEWVASTGNLEIVLTERGIRTLSNPTGGRFSLDVQAFVTVRTLTYLPVIGDPSHSAGKWQLVPGNARASLAAGAHGLELDIMRQEEQGTIEFVVNGDTRHAGFVDYAQGLRPNVFAPLMVQLREKYATVEPLPAIT